MIATRITMVVLMLLFVELFGSAVWVHNDFKGVDSVLNLK